MNDSVLFKNLFHTVERIALDPPLPGNRRAISRCMECIDDFYYQARITAEQWETLKTLLIDARV
ncbi:MAG: hypothetical protein P4L84_37775 [Isosphaeraceae bacterium]|nr:hypothetical protein [Isosphaeraceae bacterium]